MESRYALREIEGVVGLDSRTLPDGRAALFRHTAFHRRLKRDFFERRDVISVLSARLVASSAMFSHPRVSYGEAVSRTDNMEKSLIRAVFPYVNARDDSKGEANYDKYFDELDEIERQKSAGGNAPAQVGADGHK